MSNETTKNEVAETAETTTTKRRFTDIRTPETARSIEAALNSAAEGINDADYNEVLKAMCEVHHSMVGQAVNPMQRQKVYSLVFDLQCVALNPRIRRGKSSKVSRRLLDIFDYCQSAGLLEGTPQVSDDDETSEEDTSEA